MCFPRGVEIQNPFTLQEVICVVVAHRCRKLHLTYIQFMQLLEVEVH